MLTVPDSFVVEGDTTAGWTADWSGVTAADTEDDPDPAPLCSPAAGRSCRWAPPGVVRRRGFGGLTDAASFDVTVVDTTAPVLSGVPADRAVSTGDPDGVAVNFAAPTASSVVDAPDGRLRARQRDGVPGRDDPRDVHRPDASGNAAGATFDVVVEYLPVRTATWGEPVGAATGIFVANRGRTVPVKVTLAVDGEVRITGAAVLTVTPCERGTAGPFRSPTVGAAGMPLSTPRC